MPHREPSALLVEEVSTLFPELCTYAASCCHRLGCLHPEACGADVVTKYLTPEKPRKNGHVVISGEQITIYHPKAKDQRKYLFGRMKLRARSRHSRCSECEHFEEMCGIADERTAAEGDGPRVKRAVLVDPMNPEELYAEREFLREVLAAISDPAQRQLLDGFANGHTYKKLGELLHKNPATLRQTMARLRAKLRPLFGRGNRGGRK
ncbi:MAG: hypothetical protein DMF66_07295 [Acidobacteria bacterium]|nr:MAG: hypothetical protein DMF66_07295 [Acidobacteriota bacterium]